MLHYRYNKQFWFIFALIIFSLSAPLIYLIIKNIKVAIIAIILFTILSTFNVGLPESIFFDQTCIIYYLIGSLIGKHFWRSFTKIEDSPVNFLVYLVGILLAWIYWIFINFTIIKRITSVDVIINTIYALCFWHILNFSIYANDRKIYSDSFFVYALHVNIGGIVTKLIWLALPKNQYISIVNFVATISITLMLIELIAEFLRKYFKPIYKVLSGNR